MKRVVLYIIFAAIAYYIIKVMIIDHAKYMKYLKELGFGIADSMTNDEVKTSYIYLHDFARVDPTNASQNLRIYSPILWDKAKLIADKYKIFNL